MTEYVCVPHAAGPRRGSGARFRAALHALTRTRSEAAPWCCELRRHDLVKMSHDPDESRAAHKKLLDAFSDAQRAGERVVVHCRGGQSRTGLALSAWVVHAHKLSAADAAAEVERAAAEQKLVRFANAAKITAFTGAA